MGRTLKGLDLNLGHAGFSPDFVSLPKNEYIDPTFLVLIFWWICSEIITPPNCVKKDAEVQCGHRLVMSVMVAALTWS